VNNQVSAQIATKVSGMLIRSGKDRRMATARIASIRTRIVKRDLSGGRSLSLGTGSPVRRFGEG
jgi:hypothetical protein